MNVRILFTLFLLLGGIAFQSVNASQLVPNDEACEVIKSHYRNQFLSTGSNTNLDFSGELTAIGWVKEKIKGKTDDYLEEYELEYAPVMISGDLKFIVRHIRWFNWKKKIYTVYLLNDFEYYAFKAKIHDAGRYERPDNFAVRQIKPLDSKDNYDWYDWSESKVVVHKGNVYIVYDDGRFSSSKDVYKLTSQNKLIKVCDIIPVTLGVSNDIPSPSLLNSYLDNLSNIFNTAKSCSPMSPNIRASEIGRDFINNALLRPWAAAQMGWGQKRNESMQKKHFDDWQYKDVWSKREKDTFQELEWNVEYQLKEHFIKKFEIEEKVASDYARKIIEILPSYLYSLGSYYHENKNFTIYKQALSGELKSWDELLKLFEDTTNKYRKSFAPVSLFVDYPEKVLYFQNVIDVRIGVTNYGKTLLMYAAHMDNYDSVKWLLDNGWDVNAVTHQEREIYCEEVKLERDNRSALTYAVENASINLIKLLIDSGADINIIDSKGNNLDFYLEKNTKFSDEEKGLGLEKLLKTTVDQKISPSFNCSGKLNKIESSICSSDTLSIYDRHLLKEYKAARSLSDSPESIKKSQISWIKKRNKECGKIDDEGFRRSCIAQTTRARIRYLEYAQGKVSLRYQ